MAAPSPSRGTSKRNALTGPEKVGVLLLALGKAKAGQLLRRLDPDDLRFTVAIVYASGARSR